MPTSPALLRHRCDLAYRLNYAMSRDVLVAVQTRGGARILGHVAQCIARPGRGPAYVIGGRRIILEEVVSVESRRPPQSPRRAR